MECVRIYPTIMSSSYCHTATTRQMRDGMELQPTHLTDPY